MNGKTIAIDYDEVISCDIELWSMIIDFMNAHGATVYVVTYRDSTQHSDMDLKIQHVKDYIFTSGKAKRKYCKDCGVNIDIWIDDCPESIVFDYKDLLKELEIK